MKGIRTLAIFAVAVLMGLGFTRPVAAQNPTVTELVVQNDNLSTLETAVTQAGLAATLGGPGPFTVFAPANAAFNQLPQGALQQLLQNEQRLANVLRYHVVSGQLTAEDLQGRQYVETLSGDRLPVRMMNGQLMVGNAMVTQANIQASNGVVHLINEVLMPSMPVQKGM